MCLAPSPPPPPPPPPPDPKFKTLLETNAVASDWLQDGNLPFEPPVWGRAVVRQPNGRHCWVNNWEGGDYHAGRAGIDRALRTFTK